MVCPSTRYSETMKPSDVKASGKMTITSSEQKCQKRELWKRVIQQSAERDGSRGLS